MAEKIERMRIPDDDMAGWIQSLREGGFSDQEMDDILSHLNKTYAKAKGMDAIAAAKMVKEYEEYLKTIFNITLTEKEREILQKVNEKKLEEDI